MTASLAFGNKAENEGVHRVACQHFYRVKTSLPLTLHSIVLRDGGGMEVMKQKERKKEVITKEQGDGVFF